MAEEGKIYAAISGIMADIGAVGKNDLNKSQGYKYRGIEAVMNALNPAMVKNKVFCIPEILEQTREERQSAKGNNLIYSICRIRYRFFTTDGSYVDAITIGEGMDSGDKATNKAMAIAFKYACFQTFCIPTEELQDDPDKESPEAKARKTGTKKTQNDSGKETAKVKSGNEVTKEANQNTDQKSSSRWTMTAEMLQSIDKELARTGITEAKLLAGYRLNKLEDITQEQYNSCIRRFKVTPDKQERKEAANE